MVDGNPLSGDDPTIALLNLSAEGIERIQVYYRVSGQFALYGFDHGERYGAMNILNRENRRNG